MFNPKIFIPTSLALITAGVAWIQVKGSEGVLIAMYSMYDPKVVRKAHRIMLRRTLTGQYNTRDMNDDLVCTMIFDQILTEVLTSK